MVSWRLKTEEETADEDGRKRGRISRKRTAEGIIGSFGGADRTGGIKEGGLDGSRLGQTSQGCGRQGVDGAATEEGDNNDAQVDSPTPKNGQRKHGDALLERLRMTDC